jgi:predicted dithiol-disulfide oxidoreductase (DUF899 family)
MSHDPLQHLSFPGESAEYRQARNKLLESEMELRRQVERVAAQRRALPPGGPVKDYEFEGLDQHLMPQRLRLSQLFDEGSDTLIIYSFMYGPDRDAPCPGCTHTLDSLDGVARHARERVSLFIVATSPIARLYAWARDRGWQNLRFLSTASNDYNRDYFGDSLALAPEMRRQQDFKPGVEWDMPMLNAFRKTADGIRHFWGSELLYVPPEPGQDYRHNDAIDPLWGLFDVTPEGRGDFQPRLSYSTRTNETS